MPGYGPDEKTHSGDGTFNLDRFDLA